MNTHDVCCFRACGFKSNEYFGMIDYNLVFEYFRCYVQSK